MVQWDVTTGREAFWRLFQIREEASKEHHPVPLNLAGHCLLLHQAGIGSGNQSRLEYRMEWSGVTIAVSSRDEATRQLSNFYCKIPGEACLVVGFDEARRVITEILAALGGVVVDEWVRRLDLCLDLPGVNLREQLIDPFEQGHFVKTAKFWNSWNGADGKTGFTVGTAPRLKLNVYDKLVDVRRHDGIYQLAMKNRRWAGMLPEAATRVEYRIGGEWLRSYGLNTADRVLSSLPEIVARVACRPPHAFFCMTDRDPDTEHHHQSRACVLPLWGQIVDTMQSLAGVPRERLRPLERMEATLKRVWSMVRGFLTIAGAKYGRIVESLEDAMEVLRLLHQHNDGSDEDWFARWEAKARKFGTLEEVLRFIPPEERRVF